MTLISIKIKTAEPLEYLQDYHEDLISSFKTILENTLEYYLTGFGKCKLIFEYNPRTTKFKMLECTNRYSYSVNLALNNVLKQYL